MKKTILSNALSFLLIFSFQIGFAQTGNVGIGTDDPQTKLHVAGDMQVDDKTDFKNADGQTIFSIDPNEGKLKMFNESGEEVFMLKLVENLNLNEKNNGAESVTNFDPESELEFIDDEFEINVNAEGVFVKDTEIDQTLIVRSGAISFGKSGEFVHISADPVNDKVTIQGDLCAKKIITEEGSDHTTVDECGYFNEKGNIGTSISSTGIFNFDGTNNVGIIFDSFNESMQILNDVFVQGELDASVKLFRIDHPLDPYNKILQHISVESPDMMNIYNGNIITDNNGNATVQLPDYFEALNMDFCYQLTVVGSFAQAIILEEIQNNQFEIRTNEPNVKVSWQVTGIRNDTYAQTRRVQVEVPKTGDEIGKLLFEPGKKQELPAEVRELIEKRKTQIEASKSDK